VKVSLSKIPSRRRENDLAECLMVLTPPDGCDPLEHSIAVSLLIFSASRENISAV